MPRGPLFAVGAAPFAICEALDCEVGDLLVIRDRGDRPIAP